MISYKVIIRPTNIKCIKLLSFVGVNVDVGQLTSTIETLVTTPFFTKIGVIQEMVG